MSNRPVHRCSVCKQVKKRDELFVKRVVFQTMGSGARTVRSRVLSWLCGPCTMEDEDYNRESFVPVYEQQPKEQTSA